MRGGGGVGQWGGGGGEPRSSDSGHAMRKLSRGTVPLVAPVLLLHLAVCLFADGTAMTAALTISATNSAAAARV